MELPDLFSLPPLEATRALLGWELLHSTPEGMVGGVITEIEAYMQDDEASHSFRGVTPRTAPMFMEAGHVYIYRSYGLHLCLNIVLGPEGYGAGALIRSLKPTTGIEIMQKRRNNAPLERLCSGPGNVGQALGISLEESGNTLGDVFTLKAPLIQKVQIEATSRIGISKAQDSLYRFIIKKE
jgi:DNA-3-methyladenine glycosylase